MAEDNGGSGKVTIYHIAKEVGLDPSTVARALSGKGRVSAKSRERVREVAFRMGYQPSIVAKALSINRTSTVGVVVPIIGDTGYSPMVSGVEETALEKGYNIILCQTQADDTLEKQYYNLLCQRRVEGIITMPFSNNRKPGDYDDLRSIEDRGIPVVVMADIHDDNFTQVLADSLVAAKRLTEYLVSVGYKRIGVLHYNYEHFRHDIIAGYFTALDDAGIPRDDSLVAQVVDMATEGRPDMSSKLKEFLDQPDKPEAVICVDDMLAIQVIRACHDIGVTVPNDLAVVGIGDIIASQYTIPALTTVHSPSKEVGRKAASVLFDRIAGKLDYPVHERIVGRLVVRESCGVHNHQGTHS